MKSLHVILALATLVAVLFCGCTALAEVDISGLSEDELYSLREQIDARLADLHTSSSDVSVTANGGIIYEGNGCILSVASIDQNSCKILVENNSDKDYGICVHSLAINGVMTNCNPYLGRVDVPAGKKGFISFEFSDWLIEYKPDKPYNNLSMILWAYDNAQSFKDFETDVLTISIDPSVQTNTLSMGADVIEDSGLSFSAISFTDNAITIAVVNNNSYYVDFDLTNTSVNGWAMDTGISVYDVALFPGCQAVFDVSFNDVKSEGGFSTVSEFEFSLKARPNGSYYDETITDKIVFRK